jgi:chemotaxis signal transduction protein
VQRCDFLIGRAGAQRIALVLESVMSVALCARLLEVPGAPQPILGALAFGNEIVGVVDLARALGLAACLPYPARRLVRVAKAPWPLALCCDAIEQVVTVTPNELWPVPGADPRAAVKALVRTGDEVAALVEPSSLVSHDAAAALAHALQRFRAELSS